MSGLLAVRGLTVGLAGDRSVRLVEGVDLDLAAGQTLGIVGESGSGKSLTCLAMLGLLPPETAVLAGSVRFEGEELLGRSAGALTRVRGRKIGMIFQEPQSSLNPAFTVGNQLVEMLRYHLSMSQRAARVRAIELLDRVRIPDPARRFGSYPHELSGGMAQRALIAMAIACEPRLLIADEPTTALDVTVQAQILRLLAELRDALGMALVLVSHDLGVISTVADRLQVMYAGQVVETGKVGEVFAAPRHPYTSALIAACAVAVPKGGWLPVIPGQVPQPDMFPAAGCRFANRCGYAEPACVEEELPSPGNAGSACRRQAELTLPGVAAAEEGAPVQAGPVRGAPAGEEAEPVLSVTGLTKRFPVHRGVLGLRTAVVHAVDDVALAIGRARTLGVVGESGSGKSTVGRLVLRLIRPTAGAVVFDRRDLAGLPGAALRAHRRGMQMVFQDPYGSLDPMMTVGQSIAEPLVVHGAGTAAQRRQRIAELLDRVGLDPSLAQRSPRALSGGQRQRVAFARALALDPQLIVCDEPVSALDVSTRSQIINLIHDLQHTERISFLFIAHDLAMVHHVSHEIAVMYLGRIVESGPASRVYERPAHPYTRALLASVLTPGQSGTAQEVPDGEVPSPIDPPSGCRFRTRCPYAMEVCATDVPPPVPVPGGGWSACHLPAGRVDLAVAQGA